MMFRTIATITLAGSMAMAAVQAGESEGVAKDKAVEKTVKAQTVCPVMGGKINEKLYTDVEGKRIYVCCKGCIPAIEKDPAKYIKKLEDEGVTLPPAPKPKEE